ncbi:hypothetical protein COCNU_04G008050 [Cocos nucifera]|uniref:Uncharacterized protein n=1 Tax=Cocos nucifera TaxID=13894 RepID=A0A8K0I6E2_COCNU|nr:hypothetical protein COCNU_04G008050 [Cocos nucifera]
MDAIPAPPEQHEVVDKGKKKKDAIRKRLRRMVENSSGEGSDKMIGKEDAERFDVSFAAFLKLGHYLFAHSKMANLHQVEFSKALCEAQAEIERIQAEVERLKMASKE